MLFSILKSIVKEADTEIHGPKEMADELAHGIINPQPVRMICAMPLGLYTLYHNLWSNLPRLPETYIRHWNYFLDIRNLYDCWLVSLLFYGVLASILQQIGCKARLPNNIRTICRNNLDLITVDVHFRMVILHLQDIWNLISTLGDDLIDSLTPDKYTRRRKWSRRYLFTEYSLQFSRNFLHIVVASLELLNSVMRLLFIGIVA